MLLKSDFNEFVSRLASRVFEIKSQISRLIMDKRLSTFTLAAKYSANLLLFGLELKRKAMIDKTSQDVYQRRRL